MLEVRDLVVSYGPVEVLKGISFEVGEGELVAFVGANGAGKSTMLRTLSSLIRAKQGRIRYRGADVTGLPASEIVKLGIVHCPEGRRIFTHLTVLENLRLGHYVWRRSGGWEAILERVFGYFPKLEERQDQLGGTLSGGEQQMLAIGRALMAQPRLLLLDEPSLGLAPLIFKQIFQIIRDINQAGTSVLLVEQNAKAALQAAGRAYVLETGRIVLSGKGSELLHHDSVRKAYLGEAMR